MDPIVGDGLLHYGDMDSHGCSAPMELWDSALWAQSLVPLATSELCVVHSLYVGIKALHSLSDLSKQSLMYRKCLRQRQLMYMNCQNE